MTYLLGIYLIGIFPAMRIIGACVAKIRTEDQEDGLPMSPEAAGVCWGLIWPIAIAIIAVSMLFAAIVTLIPWRKMAQWLALGETRTNDSDT